MNFRKKRDREADLARELQNHLDLEAEERRAAGAEAAVARDEASRALGNQTRIREEVRGVWTRTALDAAMQDLRYGVRLLLKSPAFAAVAILTLGLGIGANTAIFTVVNALLLKPLPYKDFDRLVVLSTVFQRLNMDRGPASYPDILDWKAQTELFESVAAMVQTGFDITGGDDPERVPGLFVDRDYFRVITNAPAIGRRFEAADDTPQTNRVAILSYPLWIRRFGGDSKALGSTIDLGGVPHKVVGVMPRNTTWPEEAMIFKPLGEGAQPSPDTLRRDNHMFRVIARLKPGVTIEQAQAKLTAMASRVAKEHTNRAQTSWKVHDLREFIVGPALGRTLWILLGAVVLVLAIACVNVANLLLARGAVRQREVAIRNALGAGRGRLGVQFLIESALLATLGGVLGVALGYAGAAALVRFAPEGVPRLEAVAVDSNVLIFTLLVSGLTAILFGVAPGLNAVRRAPVEAIREGGRSSSDGARSRRLRNVLVVSELALAVILLTAAGLLVRSFSSLQQVDLGYSPMNTVTMQVSLPNSRYAQGAAVLQGFDSILERVKQTPGAESVSAMAALPLGAGGFYLGRVFLHSAQAEPPSSTDTRALWNVIRPGAFDVMKVPLLAGRSFTSADTETSMPVIIVSQSMAKQMFGNDNPIGRRIRSWRDENVYREIVGVVGDVRFSALNEPIANTAYVPHTQSAFRGLMLLVRTAQEARSLVRAIQTQVWSFDNRLAISDVKTMDEIVSGELARPRFSMYLLGVFAATALLMAAIGIYGLMSYAVAQQTKEIGIRLALGALGGDILRNVTGHALALAGAGVATGVVGALAVTRLMEGLLFGVSPTDTPTFVAASGLLIGVAVLAAYIPARRASRLDPLIALRYE